MRIIDRDFPVLTLEFSDSKRFTLNVKDFLNSQIKDPQSPYFNILSVAQFQKAYIEEDQIIWPGVINATVCSGEIQQLDAVFTEKEIISYLGD